MKDIHIGRAFGHAKALLTKDPAALALYLALGVLVPYLLHAGEAALSLRALLAVFTNPGSFFTGSVSGPIYLFAIILILNTAAMLALWNAWLPEQRDGPISEIMFALVAGLGFLLATWIATIIISILPSAALRFALAPLRLSGETAASAAAALQAIANLSLSAFIGSRLWLTGPIMAASGSMNPIAAMSESWRRTSGARGKLFGLYLAIQLVGGAVMAAMLTGHVAIIVANPGGGGMGETAMAFGWLFYWAVIFIVQAAVAGGLFRESDQGTTADVFA